MKHYLIVIILFINTILSVRGQDSLKVRSFTAIPKKEVKRDTLILTPNNPTDSEIKNTLTEDKQTIEMSLLSVTETDAGHTTGNIGVSPTGSATYTLPLNLPPGLNGHIPQVALGYNSQGSNGIAGYGWNISGMSVISRIGATKFHDNYIGGVNFDVKDRFALDGQRLLLKNGVYGADGAEYETENYSNLKIISRGVSEYGANFGPAYFEVHYPDGTKFYYGYNANSKTQTDYALTYTENPHQSRISYFYNKFDNLLYLNKIGYGSKESTNPINEINFIYKAAVRNEQFYVAGISYVKKYLLDKINVKANGIDFRNYELTYETLTPLKYQRLVKIQEFNGDKTKALTPVEFTYDNTDHAINMTSGYISLSGVDSQNAEIITGDFYGNGEIGFILYEKSNRNKIWSFMDRSDYFQLGTEVNTGHFSHILPVNFLDGQQRLQNREGFVLVKNAGEQIKFSVMAASIPYMNFPTVQYEKLWDKPMTEWDSNCPNPTNNGPVSLLLRYITGDFNGDGLSDILAYNNPYIGAFEEYNDCYEGNGYCCNYYTYNYDYSHAYLIELDRRKTQNFVRKSTFKKSILHTDRVLTGDVNGDGKTDIIHITTGGIYVYSFNENNDVYLLWNYFDSAITLNRQVLLGDYNGDGKIDIMFASNTQSVNTIVYVSTGKSFVKRQKIYNFYHRNPYNDTKIHPPFLTQVTTQLIPNDINGDGKTDMVVLKLFSSSLGPSRSKLTVSYYTNLGGLADDIEFDTGYHAENNASLTLNPIPVFLGADKPNYKFEFGVISSHYLSFLQFTKDMKKESRLNHVKQNGVEYSFEYEPLEDDSDYDELASYRIGDNQVYPYIDVQRAGGMYLLHRLKRKVDHTTVQQLFGYEGAVRHAGGLGFVGFTKQIRSSWMVNEWDDNKIFNINIHNPKLRGVLQKSFVSKRSYIPSNLMDYEPVVRPENIELNSFIEESQVVEATHSITLKPGFHANADDGEFIARIVEKDIENNDEGTLYNYITRTDYHYEPVTFPNKTYLNRLDKTITKNLLDETTTTQNFEYDEYFNTVKEHTDYSGAGTRTVEVTYQHHPVIAGYYIGRPVMKKITVDNHNETITSQEEYTYTDYLPTQVKTQGHQTAFITENLQYDNFGNVIQKTLITSAGQRTVSSTYDATGRFIISQTDTDGMTNSYTYNPSTGNILSKTNPYGQTQSYSYDTWGRLLQTTNYLGKKNFLSYNQSGSYIYIQESDEEGNSGVKILNPLGQTIQTSGKDITGQWINKRIEYDVYGRLKRESEPYTSVPSQWNVSQYDEYGRINQMLGYTGQTTSISYNGLSTTVNDGTKSVTTTKNALGQVISVQDPGGTINYTYNAAGNLKTANYDGMVQSITYDGWGRKTQLTDPSAGTYNYEYNDFGELTKEITPKGTTIYSYDNTGKLTGKTLTGDETNIAWTYIYNSTTKLLEQLTLTNADGNNATYTYTYDTYKRPASVVENNLHAIFTKSFSYDAFGRVATETSQAQDKASNRTASRTLQYHYQNGGLKKVTDQATGQRIHEISGLNHRGQVTTALMSNSLKQSDSYDSYGLPQNFITQKLGSTTTYLLNLGYSFNAERGLLNSRSNSAFSWNETFSYDNLDRLTAFNDNNGNNSHTYDSRGRITNNSLLGDYSYNGSNYQQTELINPTPTAETWYTDRSVQQITYNAFKSPVEINEDDKEIISFRYNAALQRAHMYYGDTITNAEDRRYRRHYSEDGSMEITNDTQTGTTSFVFYLGGDAYSAPAIWKEVHTTVQTTQQLYFLHRDHLGSIVLITDDEGNITEKRQFDAWGNIVKLEDGLGNPLAAFVILDRGYTGHEHLLGVALIHMNGRLYDPMLRRFLSPDNYVQDPYNTQNFNRYGYVLNNPLSHIDPSGELIIEAIIIGAAIFGYFGGTAANDGEFNPAKWDWSSGKTWAGIGIGAVAGGLGGWGFAVSGPALAGSSFFTSFANGTVAAYGITGTLAGAGAGYLTGFGVGMVNSGGDWDYANRLGTFYTGIGAAAGSVIGTIYGFTEKGREYLEDQPEYWASRNQVQYRNTKPDADGYLTLSEANYWYRNGNGEPLYVDLGRIDLAFIKASDFRTDREITYFQTLFKSKDGRVYGNLGLSLVNGNIIGTYDYYDFDIKPYTKNTTQTPLSLIVRNFGTAIGNKFAGKGTPYYIYFYGSYPIKE